MQPQFEEKWSRRSPSPELRTVAWARDGRVTEQSLKSALPLHRIPFVEDEEFRLPSRQSEADEVESDWPVSAVSAFNKVASSTSEADQRRPSRVPAATLGIVEYRMRGPRQD